ncbi:MAG: hypothetical protein L0216_14405 [Planctomycetales bacterium]|nr:hypothetical protein [Planctomycetales bacterium]
MEESEKGRSLGSWVRIVLLLLVGAALAIFLISNWETQQVKFLGARISMPLALLLLATAVGGFVLGYAARAWRRSRS